MWKNRKGENVCIPEWNRLWLWVKVMVFLHDPRAEPLWTSVFVCVPTPMPEPWILTDVSILLASVWHYHPETSTESLFDPSSVCRDVKIEWKSKCVEKTGDMWHQKELSSLSEIIMWWHCMHCATCSKGLKSLMIFHLFSAPCPKLGHSGSCLTPATFFSSSCGLLSIRWDIQYNLSSMFWICLRVSSQLDLQWSIRCEEAALSSLWTHKPLILSLRMSTDTLW